MSENNPYTAPAANLEQAVATDFTLGAPRSVGVGRGWGWIAEGFEHFKKNPGAWILILLVGFAVMIVMAFVPVIGQIAMMATYYVWIAGLMLGCRAQDEGAPLTVGHLFAGFQKPGKLIALSVLMSLVSVAIMLIAAGPVYLELIKGGSTVSPEASAAVMDIAGFWLPVLIGSLFMIPLVMALWFAPALIALHDTSILDSMKLSFYGCLKNIVPMLLYGIIAMVLYILGALLLGLGLLVVLPTLAASIYTSYKDIFIRQS